MSETFKYSREPLDPFGPQYPDLGLGVAKFRRMASGGIASMDPANRRAYGEAVERAIRAKQRAELCREAAPPPPVIKDVGAHIRAQQRAALAACPGVIRRKRTPQQWQEMYEEAMNAKNIVEEAPPTKRRSCATKGKAKVPA